MKWLVAYKKKTIDCGLVQKQVLMIQDIKLEDIGG
jgi:hypothetical protein